jgi:phosphogluconate dehydratase
VVPLLCRIYPNGEADVNHFHAAGGTGFVIRELLDAGLLHDDVTTILGKGLRKHCAEPFLGENDKGVVSRIRQPNRATRVLRKAFPPDGGMVLVQGNLGRAVMKVSAVKPQHRTVEAPALVFNSQEDFMAAYKAGQLDRDFVAVMRFQGPRANGMPELHALTPALANLQDAGRKVALVTDGRMSGASGKVPAAIHVSPEILAGGPLGLVRDGDIIRSAPKPARWKRWWIPPCGTHVRWPAPTCRRITWAWAANCSPCSATACAKPRRARPPSRCRRRSPPR